MSEMEKQAVISVYDKTDMVSLIRELAVRQWQVYGSQGTADMCNTETDKQVRLLPTLVGEIISNDKHARERVARKVSRLMIAECSIQLACLNLRPAKLQSLPHASPIDFDEGGLFMIAAARSSGALVVTKPRRYDDLLEQIDRPDGIQPSFRHQLDLDATDHITDYFVEANKLTA